MLTEVGVTKRRCRETVLAAFDVWPRVRGFCCSEGIEAHVSDAWAQEETLQPAAGGLTAVPSPCGIILLFALFQYDIVCLYAKQGKTKKRFSDLIRFLFFFSRRICQKSGSSWVLNLI